MSELSFLVPGAVPGAKADVGAPPASTSRYLKRRPPPWKILWYIPDHIIESFETLISFSANQPQFIWVALWQMYN